jgi:dTDP-4-dehydrorhamnose 3,5-epimerase
MKKEENKLDVEKEFKENGLNSAWVQMNNSLTKQKGTVRGLHFQYPPDSEVKLVRCLRGAIWDVIVDIRKNSATYGQWFGAELNQDNRTMMYVPQGFAHGFMSLTDDSEILYLVSSFYNQKSEGTLRWNDPFHGIKWPGEYTVISDKDKSVKDWQANDAIIIGSDI